MRNRCNGLYKTVGFLVGCLESLVSKTSKDIFTHKIICMLDENSLQDLRNTLDYFFGIKLTNHFHQAMYGSSSKPVGTIRYLAPEYLKPELFNEYLNLTRADIYSTALVFWELLNRTKVEKFLQLIF